jgi:sulfate adenylyltransferase large subunit
MQLLRLATTGSVDDGKSTLIGRLLHDAKLLLEDQVEAVAASTARRGGEGLDLSLVTDGLRAEREQGITIDVAYRYFATPKRAFIVADTPGHVQYTRNMVTGASTSDVAVLLVDARHGVREQTRRHAAVASLLGVHHLVIAVNKLDLVVWSEPRYREIEAEVRALADRLDVPETHLVPISALLGDNVVDRSEHTPWYLGPTLLGLLETLPIDARAWADTGLRLPVQLVIRPRVGSGDGRWYAGQLSGGALAVGDAVVALPTGRTTAITAVDGDGAAVRVQLADELDVARGELLAAVDDRPHVTTEITATVCWFSEQPLAAGDRLQLKHTTRTVPVRVTAIEHRLDVGSLDHHPADALAMNDLGRVRLVTGQPLVVDPYRRNRRTGSFVLIDERTNATVAAGLVAED